MCVDFHLTILSLHGIYWQASHSSPFSMASMEQAWASAGVKVFFSADFTTVDFSMSDP